MWTFQLKPPFPPDLKVPLREDSPATRRVQLGRQVIEDGAMRAKHLLVAAQLLLRWAIWAMELVYSWL